MPWNFQIQEKLSPFYCNHVYRCVLPHYWQDDVGGTRLNSKNISWYFNRGIDTLKITALSNQKPEILNNYITSSKYSYIISQLSRMHGKLDSSFPSVHLNFPLVVFLFFTLIHISVMTSYLVSDFHFSVTTCNIVFRYLNFSDIANEHIIPPLNIVRVILLWA